MSDNDLERRLRAESGPREQGYVESELPASFEPQARPSRLMRTAILTGAVSAGVLAVVVGSAILAGGGVPDNGAGAVATPTPTYGASNPEPVACQPMDVVLSAEPWGGAAGSRGTVITVTLADGRYPCTLQRYSSARITDADGEELVSAAVPRADDLILRAGDVLSMGVAWSNWCGPEVVGPVSLALVSGGVDFEVDVPGGAAPIPPCLGENAPSGLSVTELRSGD
jgi:Protein of unknown function (DUF4232)